MRGFSFSKEENSVTDALRDSQGILAAEYSKGPKVGPKGWLTFNIIANGRREFVEGFGVSGKVEARRIAKQRNAKCWNF